MTRRGGRTASTSILARKDARAKNDWKTTNKTGADRLGVTGGWVSLSPFDLDQALRTPQKCLECKVGRGPRSPRNEDCVIVK